MYPRALVATAGTRPDVVVDVQNGVPYLSPLATRAPVVNLVHHVHREQWPVVFGPRAARAGWWVESRLGPAVYRRTRYVAVSGATRDELVGLGVPREQVTVIHNGTDATSVDAPRSPTPRVVALGRLVPQKRLEVAVSAVAELRREVPGIGLDVVGTGWWEPNLREHVRTRGAEDVVTLHGYVSEAEKHRLLARAWVHALPSLKEGWGLVVVEAGVHGTPTVAFRDAGGPADSVRHGETGLLVDGPVEGPHSPAFADALRRMLVDADLRRRMGEASRTWVSRFRWEDAVTAWEQLLAEEAGR
jgi:glycosyltransferase involved in cell wall biosynthesis